MSETRPKGTAGVHDNTRAAPTDRWGGLPDDTAGPRASDRGLMIPPGPPITQVGAYRIEKLLGRGGMGEVYLAEQAEPKRRVALKLIRADRASAEVLARFRREPRYLARLSHANVASVYEVGVSENGRPYVAMEYVDGRPFTEYCEAFGLPQRERLDLFLQMCDAVQHAHQKSVIHRDLKPSNVLAYALDEADQPARHGVKVIDFGIARPTERGDESETVISGFGQPLGTIEYMSPEQADGRDDIDVRTDVYALGTMLYELLTGTLPFEWDELRKAGQAAMIRALLNDEPKRPTAHVRSLRGDLEWIILRALEKDRERRYASVGDLSTDLRRHLRHEPVVAGPQSQWYRLKKFSRRNPTIVAIAAAALIAAPIMTGLFFYARSESRKKSAESLKHRSVNELLTMWIEAPNAYKMGKDARVIDAVRAHPLWLHDESVDPAVASVIYPVLGRALALHASADEALDFLNRAQESGGLNPGAKAALRLLSTVPLIRANRFPEAESIFESRLSGAGTKVMDHDALLGSLADAVDALVDAPRPGSLAAVRRLLERALAAGAPSAPNESRARARAQHALAICQFYEGSKSEALASVRRALRDRKGDATPTYDWVKAAGDELYLRATLGEHAEAVAEFEELIARTQELFGRDHIAVGQLYVQLGEIFNLQPARREQAAEAMREGHRILREKLGTESYLTAHAARSLALLIGSDLRSAEALDRVREALPIFERELGAEDRQTLQLWSAYVDMLYRQRATLPDAALDARNALASAQRTYGRDHIRTLEALKVLRMILVEGEKTEELVRVCREEVDLRARLERDAEFLYASNMLASVLLERNDPENATEICDRAASWLRDRNMTSWHNWIAILRPHAQALTRLERFSEAEALLLDASSRSESAESTHRDSAPFRIGVARDLVGLYEAWCRARPTDECSQKLHLARERMRKLEATTQPAPP